MCIMKLKKGYEMKLKFMLVPLAVFGLFVESYADCSKYKILKLKDTGFTKTEIRKEKLEKERDENSIYKDN